MQHLKDRGNSAECCVSCVLALRCARRNANRRFHLNFYKFSTGGFFLDFIFTPIIVVAQGCVLRAQGSELDEHDYNLAKDQHIIGAIALTADSMKKVRLHLMNQ